MERVNENVRNDTVSKKGTLGEGSVKQYVVFENKHLISGESMDGEEKNLVIRVSYHLS